jgi:glyoxylase-like metal-dependent hydrolase (beta-lactamase superfamily II)
MADLPKMVRRVLAPNPGPMTGQGTNTYLLGEREVAVVDPGPADDAHTAVVLAAVPPGGRVVAILVTHGHADHLGGVAELKARTGAGLFGHRNLPGVEGVLDDGETLGLGGREIVAFTTPGHADDHLCFWLPDARLLLAGDLVAGVGTVVLSQTPGSLGRYLASLERLLTLGPFTLLPGHGPTIADGPARLREYLAHRAMREAQIVDSLRAGPATVDQLVARLYADVPVGLHPMAARNVRAHLELLEEKGRARVTGPEWTLSA